MVTGAMMATGLGWRVGRPKPYSPQRGLPEACQSEVVFIKCFSTQLGIFCETEHFIKRPEDK